MPSFPPQDPHIPVSHSYIPIWGMLRPDFSPCPDRAEGTSRARASVILVNVNKMNPCAIPRSPRRIHDLSMGQVIQSGYLDSSGCANRPDRVVVSGNGLFQELIAQQDLQILRQIASLAF
jgi:hypothetical protein